MRHHVTLAAAAAAASLLSGAAGAADLPGRLPPPPAFVEMARPDWSGFYVGAHVGGGWSKSYGSLFINSATLGPIPGVVPAIEGAGTGMIHGGGPLGGLQFGYNWQAGVNFVVGAEADFSFSGIQGSRTALGTVPVFGALFAFNQRMANPFTSTVRARVGFTPFDNTLVYATGGLAIGRVRHESDFWDQVDEVEAYRRSGWRLGWTLGGGVEMAIGRGWSAKVEYLHTELPGVSGAGASLLVDGTYAFTTHHSGRLTTDTVRAGVNYKFGAGAPAPLAARY